MSHPWPDDPHPPPHGPLPPPPPGPVPPPVPVPVGATLGYASHFDRPPRPGVVTAVGVLSVLMGSLGLLTNILAGIYATGFLVIGAVMPTAGTFAQQGGPPPMATSPAQRALLLDAMSARRPLTPQRRKLLDDFLSEEHLSTVPILAVPSMVTAQSAPGFVSAARTRPGPPGGATVDSYDLGAAGAALEVSDGYAACYAVRALPPARALTPAEIERTLTELGELSEVEPSPEQVEALRRALADPGQRFLTDRRAPEEKLAGARATPSGALAVHNLNSAVLYLAAPTTTGAGATALDPAATDVEAPAGATAATPAPAAPSATAPATGVNAPVNAPAWKRVAVLSGLALVEAVASFGLAIFLLVIGIMTLRDRNTRRKHYVFALLKLPLAAAMAVAWYGMIAGMLTAAVGVGGPALWARNFNAPLAFFAAVCFAFSAAYPLLLFILLGARSAREYDRLLGT